MEAAAAGPSAPRAEEGAGPSPASWIQRLCNEVLRSSQLSVSLAEAPPVAVVAVERYMAESPPPPSSSSSGGALPKPPAPAYCYDVTLADGSRREKCYLAPPLNALVQRGALRAGGRLRLTRCSYLYDEKKLSSGFLCLERLDVLRDPPDLPPGGREPDQQRRPPLKGGRSHYLPLWNNEDPYGDIWLASRPPERVDIDVSKLTSLGHLEMNWRSRIHFSPLLVRILHKARLRYYGKPDKKLDIPYQAYFEVADSSGMMSMVLWNSLCPEWYNSMKIGTVLLLEQYGIKTSYPFKTQPTPGDSQMKRFTTIEISLNVRDPPTKINIIPEKMVKPEWRLPEVRYRFVTRSELDNLPNNHSCDIIGLVIFVGRAERTRKREYSEDFWIHRWAHVVDGTSDQPFILELFATSQPDVFEHIHPMTYLVCTQMRVVRDITENTPRALYLTTSNESQMFITGWHKGQPYTRDAKVKNFIQWIKTQSEADQMKKTVIGGYCPFPPAPNTFLKYCKNNKVESVLKAISEMEREIEDLHYREHKRFAVQGIISAIKYVSYAAEDASGVEPIQEDRDQSASQKTIKNTGMSKDCVTKGKKRSHRNKEANSVLDSQCASLEQQQHPRMLTRKSRIKRKIEHRTEPENLHEFQQEDSVPKQNILTEPDTSQPDRGINHDVAIDVAFPPMFCPEDPHLFRIEDIQNDMLLSCMSCISVCQQDTTSNQKLYDTFPLSMVSQLLPLHAQCSTGRHWSPSTAPVKKPKKTEDETVKAAVDLDRQHVICILDICRLGEDKVEVFLNKIYKIMETDVVNLV
nr:RPA-related protein RADX isoform X4 [Caretta caretta]